jgi:hypothetical protein
MKEAAAALKVGAVVRDRVHKWMHRMHFWFKWQQQGFQQRLTQQVLEQAERAIKEAAAALKVGGVHGRVPCRALHASLIPMQQGSGNA